MPRSLPDALHRVVEECKRQGLQLHPYRQRQLHWLRQLRHGVPRRRDLRLQEKNLNEKERKEYYGKRTSTDEGQ